MVKQRGGDRLLTKPLQTHTTSHSLEEWVHSIMLSARLPAGCCLRFTRCGKRCVKSTPIETVVTSCGSWRPAFPSRCHQPSRLDCKPLIIAIHKSLKPRQLHDWKFPLLGDSVLISFLCRLYPFSNHLFCLFLSLHPLMHGRVDELWFCVNSNTLTCGTRVFATLRNVLGSAP